MLQTATIISTKDNIAVIEVSRKAMCDGCHKSGCDGGGCPMSGLFSAGGKMTANAVNKIGAKPGDTVAVETSDKEVLSLAVLIFMVPIILGWLFYSIASFLGASAALCTVFAVIGFAAVFPFLRIAEKRRRKRLPKLTVIRIVSDNDKMSENN